MNNSLYSPFLCLQQVPGTPFLDVPTSVSSPGSRVPDIDERSGSFRFSYGSKDRTPKSAPATPGMTVPSPAQSREDLGRTQVANHKEKSKNKCIETPKR
ncbi:hypothetical protein QZH41_009362, partial [Actinostola sp. cb2023]